MTRCLSLRHLEEYINYGVAIIADKLKEDERYFYNKNSFIVIFKELTHPKVETGKIVSENTPE